jgi:hypothetical protein
MPREGRWMGQVVLDRMLLLLVIACAVNIVCPHVAMMIDNVELSVDSSLEIWFLEPMYIPGRFVLVLIQILGLY